MFGGHEAQFGGTCGHTVCSDCKNFAVIKSGFNDYKRGDKILRTNLIGDTETYRVIKHDCGINWVKKI